MGFETVDRQGLPRHDAVEDGHDRASGRPQMWPIDLETQHSQLVAQQGQFGLWVPDPASDVGDIKNQA